MQVLRIRTYIFIWIHNVLCYNENTPELSDWLPGCCNVPVGVYHIYPTPPLGQDMTQGQFLSGV